MNPKPHAIVTKPVIEFSVISKRYPGVKALSDVTFSVYPGSIHGLAGENGSGKSTLLRILTGLEEADSGEVRVSGKTLTDFLKTSKNKIAMVTQEPSLVRPLTVAENIAFSNSSSSKLFVNWNQYKEVAKAALDQLKANIDINAKAETLPPDQEQLVSIARALAKNPDILLLDEATSSLTEDQTENLFSLLDELREKGKIIIFISHRLKEYTRLCDRITVLRDSEFICELQPPAITEEQIVNAMVGRQMSEYFPTREPLRQSEIAISMTDYSCGNNVKEVSLSIRKGEIFVLAGLVGCGRSELIKGIYGISSISGTLEVFSKQASFKKPREAMDAGLAYIPAERKSEGIVAGLSVQENGVLSLRLNNHLLKWINFKKEKEKMEEMVQKLTIKTSSLSTPIETLSGGNQQKVILSRMIAVTPKILLLDEPTRGIDVGAKAEIYNLLNQLTKEGMTVIISTSDLQEAIGIGDRVGVMFRGRLQKILSSAELSEEKIMYYATGNE